MTKIRKSVVWITGASSGIGAAAAIACAREGASVILSARSREGLEAVARETGVPREQLMILPLDLAQPENFPAAVASVLEAFGQIDVLINNAGISQRSLAMDTSLDVDRRLMEINYFGTLALTKAVLPSMLERKEGHIVVVSSLVGKFGTPLRSGYAASKHALHGYFDSLRAELYAQGIKVSMVCPGFVRTQISIAALTGGGKPQGTMDEATDKGMAPERFAEKLLRAIERDKAEVYIGGAEIRGVYMQRFFPGILRRILRKARVV
jgi:dehydrogenase/reductase SDR family protein 7B